MPENTTYEGGFDLVDDDGRYVGHLSVRSTDGAIHFNVSGVTHGVSTGVAVGLEADQCDEFAGALTDAAKAARAYEADLVRFP